MKKAIDKPITLEVLADFWEEVALPSIDRRFVEERQITNQGFKNVENELTTIKGDINLIKREIQDIKAELSDTPKRTEFESLRQIVTRKAIL